MNDHEDPPVGSHCMLPCMHRRSEGPLAKDAPLQTADIKLILSGKFLDAAKLLKGTGVAAAQCCE